LIAALYKDYFVLLTDKMWTTVAYKLIQ